MADDLPKRVKVILDTNNVRSGDYVLKSSLRLLLDSFKDETRVKVVVYIPEPVKTEWVRQFHKEALGALTAFNNSTNKLSKMASQPKYESLEEEELVGIAESYVGSHDLEFFEPDYSKMDIKELFRKVAWGEPPFNPGSEKGFKDSVIALSFEQFVEPQEEGTAYYIGTQDGLLNNYLKEQLKQYKNVQIYTTNEEIQTAIELTLEHLNEKLAEEAVLLFADESNPSGLFSTTKMPDKLAEVYDSIFKSPEAVRGHILELSAIPGAIYHEGIKHIAFGNGRQSIPARYKWRKAKSGTRVGGTGFSKRVGQSIEWVTVVIFKQTYDLYDPEETEAETSYGTVTHEMYTRVKWKTTISEAGLKNPEIIKGPEYRDDSCYYRSNVSLADAILQAGSLPSLSSSLAASLATLSGQSRLTDALTSGMSSNVRAMLDAISGIRGAQNAISDLKNLTDTSSKLFPSQRPNKPKKTDT